MSLIARMAYNPQLVWCLIAGSKEKISTEHMLSIWDLGFANGHNTKIQMGQPSGSDLFVQRKVGGKSKKVVKMRSLKGRSR